MNNSYLVRNIVRLNQTGRFFFKSAQIVWSAAVFNEVEGKIYPIKRMGELRRAVPVYLSKHGISIGLEKMGISSYFHVPGLKKFPGSFYGETMPFISSRRISKPPDPPIPFE